MQFPSNNHVPVKQVTATTSARLHMGFYDLLHKNRFGSLGLSIDSPITNITITKSEKPFIAANGDENVVKIIENFINVFNLKSSFALTVNQTIATHTGFGSGTQMALAIGAALNKMFNLNLNVLQIAAAANRGRRSGIGIATFMHGGVVVDTGILVEDGKISESVPEIALRQNFPENWRVLLITDSAHVGVHDVAELQAFQTLKPVKTSLQSMVFNHMMPALQRADLFAFGTYMQDLQAYNGDYFAPIQGGRFANKDVAEVLAWLQTNGANCVGQTSWGPTGFAILENSEQVEHLQSQAQIAFADKPTISFSICRGKNNGAIIKCT